MLENVLILLQKKLKSSDIKLVREYGDHLPLVRGDAVQIQELFMNLVLNSCDAMPNGGELRLAAEIKDSSLITRIMDTGVGIPSEQLSRIFEPFFTTKEANKGVGLGLFVVRNIAERNGGSISVESKEGQGSTFTLSLPLVDGSSSKAKQFTASYTDSRNPLS